MNDVAGVKRWIPALGWGLCVIALGSLIASAVLQRVLDHATDQSVIEQFGLLLGFSAFPVIGAVVASRHPRNPLGWIFLQVGLGVGLLVLAAEYSYLAFVKEPDAGWPGGLFAAWLEEWLWFPGLMAIPTLCLILFPDGRPPSPRWRWLVWASSASIAVVTGATMFQTRIRAHGSAFDNPVGFLPFADGEQAVQPVLLVFFGLMLLSVASLVVRFRRGGPEQRQQVKLLMFASAIFGVAIFLGDTFDLPEIIFPMVLWLIPGSVGVAILKYRLYDIDVAVNLTLVYATLTGILVLCYLGIVFILQELLTGITEESDLAVAGSTLAVAALFRPLRSRVQGFIDQRFYRRRYDARQTLESFSARLRDDVDLDHMAADLTRVISETVQPAHVSLWLKPSEMRPS